MNRSTRKYDKYKRGLQCLLVPSGIWPSFEPRLPCLRTFLNVFSAFSSGWMFCSIVAFCTTQIKDIVTLARTLGLVIAFFSSFVKICTLWRCRKYLMRLNEGISAKFEEDLKISRFRKHLMAYFPKFKRFFYLHSCVVGVTNLLLIIMPLTMIKHGKYTRTYPQHLPFTYEPGGTLHWCLLIFESICGFYLFTVTCGVDSIFGFYSLHIVGELKLLASHFENLRCSSNYRKDLKEFVERHLLLMESKQILQRVFGFLTVLLAITCAIALCSLVYQATQIKRMTFMKICYLIGHCFIKLVQAYTYGWYGNIIAKESEACLSSIYNSNWPGSGNKQFMNDVLIVISQRPMRFIGMHFMHLRLDMFSKIVQASVSYFFLLKTLEAKYVE